MFCSFGCLVLYVFPFLLCDCVLCYPGVFCLLCLPGCCFVLLFCCSKAGVFVLFVVPGLLFLMCFCYRVVFLCVRLNVFVLPMFFCVLGSVVVVWLLSVLLFLVVCLSRVCVWFVAVKTCVFVNVIVVCDCYYTFVFCV